MRRCRKPARPKPQEITCIADFPPPLSGNAIKWLQCRDCKQVFRYEYLPYSLSNPITWTTCGHSTGHRDLNCDEVSEQVADAYFRKMAKQKKG